jgi:type IV pilus assembly protein PilV
MKPAFIHRRRQTGASLIEVLVAVLLLSFGMLSLGAMMSFGVQLPKLSANRATAANIAADYVERIRANPGGFHVNSYNATLSYDGTFNPITLSVCSYPNCTAAALATMDFKTIQNAARIALPAGGMLMKCENTPCGVNGAANLWIVWQEPTTFAAFDPTNSDNCPTEVTSTYTSPKPRCLYVRFKID